MRDQILSSNDGLKKYLGVTEEDLDELWAEVTHYYQYKEFENAVETLAYLIFFEPTQPIYLTFFGSILFQMEKITEALTAFMAAGELAPEDPALLLYTAQCQALLNQNEAAHASFAQCIEVARTSQDPKAEEIRQQAEQEIEGVRL